MNSRKKIGFSIGFIALVIIAIFLIKNYSPLKSSNQKDEYVTAEMDINDPDHPDYDKIENGIHLRTGFVEGNGLQPVINNCTSCHSAKLVTQNRMSKEKWLATIRWMQETQNLWDLGANEEIIVNYLATYYAPSRSGRRKNLGEIEWYELEGN